MPKSESGPGRNQHNSKMNDGQNQADIWAMRDHLELRQQLISSADVQSNGGTMSVLGMQTDDGTPHVPRSGANSATLRMYHHYDSETLDPNHATKSALINQANARLFGGARSSAATLSCSEGFPMLGPNQGYRQNDGDDEFVVDVNQMQARMYHQHMLQQQQQQQHHHHHRTMPRLSIATMPSPGPNSLHRYEPLLTTTSSNGPGFCPPPAQTPDSGCDIEQQQRQRASLSSSSYGGGSVSSSNQGGHYACPGLSTSQERPRLSSFQPICSSSNNATPTNVPSANKTSFLHLSRVLPPTPGQIRSQSSLHATSTVTVSSSNDQSQQSEIGVINLPPAPPQITMSTHEDDITAQEMQSLDGLIKDLKLNVATSSSATLTAGNS